MQGEVFVCCRDALLDASTYALNLFKLRALRAADVVQVVESTPKA